VAIGIALGGTLYKGGDWFGEYGPVALFASALVAAAGVVGVLVYVQFWRHGAPGDSLEAARTFFWLAAGTGMVWLAVDDLFYLHGHVSGLVPHLPIVGTPDDLIVVAYAVLGLIVVRLFLRHLVASPAQFALLTAASVFGLGALALDFAPPETAFVNEFEEGMQLVTGGFLLSAAGVAYREAVSPGTAGSQMFTRASASEVLATALAPTRRNVLHWLSWAVSLGTVTAITLLVIDGRVYGWEVDLTREIQSWSYPMWLFRMTSEHLTDPMSHVGSGVFLAAAGLLWFTGRRVEAFIVLLIFPLHVLGNFPKALVERDRPSEVMDGISGIGGGKSFPSGHSEFAISFYGFLVFLVVLELKLGWQRALLVVAWLTFVTLCGTGRIAYGRHWPLDVLASYVMGAGILSGLIWLHAVLRAPFRAGAGQRAPPPRDALPAARLSTHGRAG
jgi:undecaprenyl-diphosphatase